MSGPADRDVQVADDPGFDPSTAHTALLARAAAWADDDVEPGDQAEIRDLLADAGTSDPALQPVRAAALTELADRFARPLEFGTAGLRGAMAAGPNRMNRAVVIRAAAGLGAFLHGVVGARDDGAAPPLVVVGYDARHHSRTFALDTAAVLTAAGVAVRLLPAAAPTPVLAYWVRAADADAGVMVTASHNPPADNGYKVYLGGRVVTGAGRGAQLVPPDDARIAAAIAAVGPAREVPRARDGWTVLGIEAVHRYTEAVLALADDAARNLRIVTTSMHGVGGATLARVLRSAGFRDVVVVAEQAEPDPDFPTVAFPNPEESGAIDLALGYAVDARADLVIANDPDADRCAVAVLDRRVGTHHGAETARSAGWRMLHGDEVGALLGADAAARVAASARAGRRAGSAAVAAPVVALRTPDGEVVERALPLGGGVAAAGPTAPGSGAPVLACSIVSSRLLGRIAAAHGLDFATTLTGFKWISRVPGLAFGYEEALGYCVDPAHVRDKDGISAALLIAQLANRLKAAGRTLIDALDDLARAHGLHLTDQVSARFTDLDEIGAIMSRLRNAPPRTLTGVGVAGVADLAAGLDGLPPTDGIRLLTADGSRVVVRPSGTEPKLKCYLEVIEPVAPDASFDDLTAARARARARLDRLAADVRATLGIPPS